MKAAIDNRGRPAFPVLHELDPGRQADEGAAQRMALLPLVPPHGRVGGVRGR